MENPGGSSSDRRKIKRMVAEAMQERKPTLPAISPEPPRVTLSERVLRFIDHSSVQTLASVVGGLVGTFLDGRYFAGLGLLVSYGLYRSKALDNIRPRIVLLIHGVSIAIAGCAFFYMGIQVNKTRPQTFTPTDYITAIKNRTQLPITQQITNVYNSYLSPTKSLSEPRIDLTEYLADSYDAQGLHFHANETNGGTAPAIDVVGSVKGVLAERSSKSEDDLFNDLSSRANDSWAPKADMYPGEPYHTVPLVVPPFTEEDKAEFQAGLKVLYLGIRKTYSDKNGKKYYTELCMFMVPGATNLLYCNGHNMSRQIKQ